MSPLAPRIRALRASGLTLRAIAAEVGCGYGTVQKHAASAARLWANGVAPVAPEPPRRGACQWIEGNDRPWRFTCTEPALDGFSWCAAHKRIVYVRTVWRVGEP